MHGVANEQSVFTGIAESHGNMARCMAGGRGDGQVITNAMITADQLAQTCIHDRHDAIEERTIVVLRIF